MKQLSLLLLVFLITSCSKTTPPAGPAGDVGIRISNQTDLNIISLDVVVSTIAGGETISYSNIGENSITDYTYIAQLKYMYLDESKPVIEQKIKATVKNGNVEAEGNSLFAIYCGPRLTTIDTEKGLFRLNITSIDVDQGYLIVEGVDEN